MTATGLGDGASIGDHVEVLSQKGTRSLGEIQRLDADCADILPYSSISGHSIGDRVILRGQMMLAPGDDWTGRLIDPFGAPLDGRPLRAGTCLRSVQASPPAAAQRRPLGTRMETGLAAFNTVLPIVLGQRIGLFAGSGVGKSSLLASLAQGVSAERIVIALIGERGREVRHFVEEVLGTEGMSRSVVVAATSDQSALCRRRCAWTAMAVAEHFRDHGHQVLLLVDSVTRFAEAHREVALATGEDASFRGFPPSVTHAITSLAERAGPGCDDNGDITAIFSVLVAGSDMDEPVADVMRGVLDGHVVLDRAIAERGRYPAIDLLRSVSRSLPTAASETENSLIQETRALLSAYEQAELMIRSGLYVSGNDAHLDRAIACWSAIDHFLSLNGQTAIAESFEALRTCLSGKGVPQAE